MILDKFEDKNDLDKSVEIVGSGPEFINLNLGFAELDLS